MKQYIEQNKERFFDELFKRSLCILDLLFLLSDLFFQITEIPADLLQIIVQYHQLSLQGILCPLHAGDIVLRLFQLCFCLRLFLFCLIQFFLCGECKHCVWRCVN